MQDNNGFPSAGYHGYWVTDFTQIDPHFGTNAELKALIDEAHAKRHEGLLRHHHQPHRGRHPYEENNYTYVSKDAEPFKTAAGTPFDDRDYAGGAVPAAHAGRTSFPYTPVDPPDIDQDRRPG